MRVGFERAAARGVLGAAGAALLLAAAPAAAQDRALEERLAAQGYTYEVDADGDYKMVISWNSDGRSQIVFVGGRTEELGSLAIREVFAPAAFVKKHRINGTRALALLAHAGEMKVGSWEIRGDILYYVAKVPDTLSAPDLDKLITTIAEVADNKEIELTRGKDDF